MKRIYAALLSLALIIPNPGFARDELPAIYISEINWAGSERTNADEWIELYNRTDQEVDLGGWVLTGVASGGDAIALAEGTVIRAESTLLIANYAGSSEKTTLLVEPDLVTSSLSLINSGLEVMLTGPDGTVVDDVTVDDWDAGGNEPFASMERTVDGWETAELSANLLGDQLGTPGVHVDASVMDNHDDGELHPCTVAEESIEVNEQEPSDDEIDETESTEEDGQVEEIEADGTEEPNNQETPSQESSNEPSETTTPIAVNLQLSEIHPNPLEGGEWIEIAHDGSQTSLLDGWRLEDASGKRTVLEGEIGASELFIITLPNQILNNSGDTVKLIAPDGKTVDETDYSIDAPKKGESWSFVNSLWQRSPATPAEFNTEFSPVENELQEEPTQEENSESSAPKETTVNQTKNNEKTHTVVAIAEPNTDAESPEPSSKPKSSKEDTKRDDRDRIEGVITGEPGIFGTQIAFIEGYQLYFYHADWPEELVTGSVVQVTGEESSSRGEKRFKIATKDDIDVLGSQDESPQSIGLEQLDKQPIGTLVQVEAEVIERDSRTLTIDQDGTIAEVVLHDALDIDLKRMLGNSYTVTGVIRTLNGNTRIYPRTEDDLTEFVEESSASESSVSGTSETIEPNSGNKELYLGVTFLAAAAAATGYFAIRHYGPKLKSLKKPAFKTLKITTVN